FSSRRRHTRFSRDWSSDVCSSDLERHRLYAASEIAVEELGLSDVWLLTEGHCFRDQVLQLCREVDGAAPPGRTLHFESGNLATQIGRASCRERADGEEGAGWRKEQ